MSQVRYFRDLLCQEERIEAFRRAIAATVRPGDTVLEVGTGLGTFAFFAADQGAARVWAVDGDPIVHVARAVARHNGYCDRITFVRGWLPDVALPGRANVIVLEDFSARLVDGRLVRLLRGLHDRYAAAGARFVPQGAQLFMAPVASEPLWTAAVSFGRTEARYGIDWSASREYVANAPHTIAIPLDALAGAPAPIGSARFDDPATFTVGGEHAWEVAAPVVHGLAFWYDLELSPGERLSNGPGAVPGSWGHLFLPIDPPLDVGAGKLVARVGLRNGGGGVPDALWWTLEAGGVARRGHEFRSVPASLDEVLVGSPDYVPALGPGGELESRVLALTDGRRTVRDIAAGLEGAGAFHDLDEAERYVARILKERVRPGSNGAAGKE